MPTGKLLLIAAMLVLAPSLSRALHAQAATTPAPTPQAVTEPDPLKAINLLRTELVDAFNKADVDRLLSHLDPDVVLTWQNGEVCRGPEAVRAYYNRMMTAPDHVVAKITAAGNPNVLVTERGASFGYNTLVSDMRALPILARTTGAPVIFDATHSVQQPGGKGTSSGGEREFVPVLARAAVAVGVAGVFIETHQDPDRAPSDGPNMVPLKQMQGLLQRLVEFDQLAKNSR